MDFENKTNKCTESLTQRDSEHADKLTRLRNQQQQEVSSLHAELAAVKEKLSRQEEHTAQQDTALNQCAKVTQNMLDSDQDFDSYHGLLDITNLTRETMEWPLYLHEDVGLPLWRQEHNATVVCIAGKFNAGKSQLASRIYDKSFPTGDDVPTMGISFAFLQHPETGWRDLVLDSAGARAPIGSVNREMHDKLVEDIQTDLCFQAADLSIMVVNEMSQNDQDQMHALGHDRSLQSIIDRGASLVVVHNFRGAHSAEDLLGYWQRFVLNAFPDLVEKPCLGNQLTYGDATLKAVGGSGEMRVRHVALANEHSWYGRGHNALVYRALRDWIVDQKRAGEAWRPADRLLQPLRELLPAKYFHAGEAPRIEFSEASHTTGSEPFPDLCRGFAKCTRVSGKLRLSQVLRTSWPHGVTPDFKLRHSREGYRSIMRRATFGNETVEQERRCSEDRSECHVVFVLPGCAPSVEVTKMSGGIEAFVRCCRTPALYAGITSDKFMFGCFNETAYVDLHTHVFAGHSYKSGILDLHFVSRDRAAGMRGLAWSNSFAPMEPLALPFGSTGIMLGIACWALMCLRGSRAGGARQGRAAEACNQEGGGEVSESSMASGEHVCCMQHGPSASRGNFDPLLSPQDPHPWDGTASSAPPPGARAAAPCAYRSVFAFLVGLPMRELVKLLGLCLQFLLFLFAGAR